MPKIQAITDEMTATAGRIGSNVDLMEGRQEKIRQLMSTILVHFNSKPKVLPLYLLSNVILAYRNTSESLRGYQGFLVDAANTYEWNDQQLARWGTVMQDRKGVDIYNPPSADPTSPTNPTNDYSYDAADYQGYNAAHGRNCYSFVNQVLKDQGRGALDGWANGAAYLNGKDTIDGGQYIISNGGNPTGDVIKAMFSNAQNGDVVQMRWAWRGPGVGVTPHTAIISKIDENGVEFLHSNLGDGKVKNSHYSWNELARRYSNAGEGGGASIYRYG